MGIAMKRLTACIGRAVRPAQFRNVHENRFDSSVMHEFYARKVRMEYCPSNTDAISVHAAEPTDLVSVLMLMVGHYTAPETSEVSHFEAVKRNTSRINLVEQERSCPKAGFADGA